MTSFEYILVTGGNSGLGLRVVAGLNELNYRCLIVSRTRKSTSADNIDSYFFNPLNLHLKGDVSNPDFIDSIPGILEEQNSILIGVVHCAATLGKIGSIEDISYEDWRGCIDINLSGTFNVLKMATSEFKKNGKGNFVSLSGGGAADPRPRILGYSASKTAVVRLIESVAEDNRNTNLTFNSVAPGVLPTRMNEIALSEGSGTLPGSYLEKLSSVFSGDKNPEDYFVQPVQLIISLVLGKFPRVSGKLVSAVWDDWENSLEHINETDNSNLLTLRRVTEVS